MLPFKPQFFPFLATLLFLSSALFSVSHGESHFLTSQRPQLSVSGEVYEVPRRRLLEEGESGDEAPLNSSSLVLAAKRTYRKDPLDGFKRYTGGWNISEPHYWASVAFTAVPFFVIAAAWFVLFGICLFLICLCHCCCKREPYGYSRIAYALSLIFLIVFTVAAIIGCVVLYTGQGKFHKSTTKTLEYVVDQASTTVEKLNDVSGYLLAAKQVGVDSVFVPSSVQTDIDEIGRKLNSSATNLLAKTKDNSGDIKDFLNSVRVALIIIAAFMLALTILGFIFSIFGMQSIVYILVIVGWIVVTGTFILCGIFLLLHNVAEDACVSMDQWVEYPTAHTALDDILPCVDNATAQETLVKTKEVSSQLVEVVNQVITNISNINFSPNFKPVYFNQSGPLVPILCNPFKSDLTERACTAGEVDLNNATEVWKSFVCEVSASGICTTRGRLTPEFYNQMSAAVNVSYALSHYGPFLVDLQDCTFVRETFTDITRDHCPGLQLYSSWIYSGLVLVSAAVMLSLVFWVIYGRERKHRVYTKQRDDEFNVEGLAERKNTT